MNGNQTKTKPNPQREQKERWSHSKRSQTMLQSDNNQIVMALPKSRHGDQQNRKHGNRVLTETTRTYIGGSIASLGNHTGKLDVFMEEKKTRPPHTKKKKSLKLRPKCKILNCKTDKRR